jgi:hypothetical protein
MPRGDMAGTVLFTDRTNRLCCEIQFGEIKVRLCPLKCLRQVLQLNICHRGSGKTS